MIQLTEVIFVIASIICGTNSRISVRFLCGIIALMSFPPISPTRTNEFLKKLAQSVIEGNKIVSNYMEKQKKKQICCRNFMKGDMIQPSLPVQSEGLILWNQSSWVFNA